jgi:hypothetical protein
VPAEPAYDLIDEVKRAREKLKTWEGRNELNRECDDVGIEDRRGDRTAQGSGKADREGVGGKSRGLTRRVGFGRGHVKRHGCVGATEWRERRKENMVRGMERPDGREVLIPCVTK